MRKPFDMKTDEEMAELFAVKTEDEIAAEKSQKPAIELVPPELYVGAGRALAYGRNKHGLGPDTWGTWRIPGHQQNEPLTHFASVMRHLAEYRSGQLHDPSSGLSVLDHAAAHLGIIMDLENLKKDDSQ